MTRQIGRPTECTVDIIREFAEYREDGLPLCDCAALCGIGTTSYKNWVIRASAGEEPYLSFLSAIKKAEATFKQKSIQNIKRSHESNVNNWTATMTLLERLYPSEFGRNQTRIHLEKPSNDLNESQKLQFLSDQVMTKVSAGEMSVEAATAMMTTIDNRRKLNETLENTERIAKIQEQLKKMGIEI